MYPEVFMTLHSPLRPSPQLDRLAESAAALGYEIVDIVGFLDLVETHARNQRGLLSTLGQSAQDVVAANGDVRERVVALGATSEQALREVQSSVSMVRTAGGKTRDVAVWVKALADRTDAVGETLKAVKANNSQIAQIATQVNTLAINAKIEAARAGEAGRGFAVVADAINDLSQKTRTAAKQISENIESLTGWIDDLGQEAESVADDAGQVLDTSSETDNALSRMENTIQTEHEQTLCIASSAERAQAALTQLQPAVQDIDATVRETSDGIETAHARMLALIDSSEHIVQSVASLGGTSVDAPFIAYVQKAAKAISDVFDAAVARGEISDAQLFDRQYQEIRGSHPAQFSTRALDFLDRVLPDIQEPALEFDSKVVFCAAVDVNGYLPTHNRMFSQPQSSDVVWNTAHCRNRRIFDDRVGLKAGRNTEDFLLQVYRRDMGGGEFRVMKDLSAPIRAGGATGALYVWPIAADPTAQKKRRASRGMAASVGITHVGPTLSAKPTDRHVGASNWDGCNLTTWHESLRQLRQRRADVGQPPTLRSKLPHQRRPEAMYPATVPRWI